jgi:hypothetical protein
MFPMVLLMLSLAMPTVQMLELRRNSKGTCGLWFLISIPKLLDALHLLSEANSDRLGVYSGVNVFLV